MTEESEFSSDASNTNVHRHRTPKTIPRTKMTSTTPVEQRLALSKLKQKLDFDDNKVIFYFLFIDFLCSYIVTLISNRSAFLFFLSNWA